MSADKPHFLVSPYHDPVVVKVMGKATFQNAAPLKETLNRLLASGANRFVLDFKDCSGMDSTFLGILAGLAIRLRQEASHSSVVLCHLGERNLELVRNLGLHRILTVDTIIQETADEKDFERVGDGQEMTEIENARMVLKAHENLIEVDTANQNKFQDVIDFLKNQIDDA